MRKIGSKSLLKCLASSRNFRIFIKAVYYYGKGRGRRELDHIKDTLKALKGTFSGNIKVGGKILACINEILANEGIVIVTGFHDSSNYMALNREASLMDFAGIDTISNDKRGSKYGDFAACKNVFHKNFGMMTLYTLFLNYINNGARAFTFEDLCNDIGLEDSIEKSPDVNCNHKKLVCKSCKNCFNNECNDNY